MNMPYNGFAHHQWWKEAVVYQVWPASFCQKNRHPDGWGDIPGITSKLDHLQELGVDVLWLSPVYTSPQVDMGYDIADYKDIEPRFGTLSDVDHLIAELKKRNMKLMMDLVVNHTSDEHNWFKESRSSKDHPKRSWYIWKPARYDKDGKRHPPNNWSMILGEESSAWVWDEQTEEYFLALFTNNQPDLNWEVLEVREAVYDVMRFWMEKGCCGFRMDVINHISKDQRFPDAPVVEPDHPYQPGQKYFANGPRMDEFLKGMNQKVLSKYDSMTVGEAPFAKDEESILRMVAPQEKELNMIFIFGLVAIDDDHYRMSLRDWKPKELKQITNHWQRFMIDNNGWYSIFMSNHDNPRSVSRYTDDSDENRGLGAKLLALMQTTLSGTPFIYQGEELGMRNFPLSWGVEEYKDVESLNYWHKTLSMYPNDKDQQAHARKVMQAKARDHARTPVQWSSETHAGFCAPDVKPWMRVNDDYKDINAEKQVSNQDGLSVYQFWKRGLENRKRHAEVFVYGDFKIVDPDHESLFIYLRTSKNDGDWLVVLNFTGKEVEWTTPSEVKVGMWCAGNYTAGKPEKATEGRLKILPWEGILGMCQ